ncbi:GPX3 [Auxenochlorella protothecoides x Auxenochlorella symbiontica]
MASRVAASCLSTKSTSVSAVSHMQSCSRLVQKPAFAARLSAPAFTRARPSRAFTTSVRAAVGTMPGTVYDFSVTSIDGQNVPLNRYKNKVLLIVNVASQCGFTPQYLELVELQSKFNSKGFEVLAFPCNQFGKQEPGTAEEIKAFAKSKGANFPLFAKINVNGSDADPLWKWLKGEKGGFLVDGIKWNFTKFLVDKEGKVVKRYGSTTTPGAIADDIAKLV